MPTITYIALGNITLGGSAASVTFSSIPATYRDLVLVVNGTTTSGSTANSWIRFNGDTGSNYSYVRILGDGSSVSSSASTGNNYLTTGDINSAIFTSVIHIMDYSATDKHKTALSKTGNVSAYLGAYVGRWANTAAITSVLVSNQSGDFTSGTTFALYGIAS
jgi:hypothetical protein